jgi:hypothetical protein
MTMSSGTWHANMATETGNGAGFEDSGSDKTTTGTVTATYGYTYGPTLVLGSPLLTTANKPIIALIGDSIIDGQGDQPLDRGFATTALRSSKFLVKFAIPGGGTGSQIQLKQGGLSAKERPMPSSRTARTTSPTRATTSQRCKDY